ncbi:hypothetical protein G6514_001422 [Epicoccum nigrum]|nr:hypothetical protein G6514_001422 [Epicoccum nigrum]
MDHLPHLSLLTTSEGISQFLELPREIRDMIYDYIWTAIGAIKLCHGNRIYTITYQTSHWESTQGLSIPKRNEMWLMTNKQIMKEGLWQLRRHAVWHINDGAARFKYLQGFEEPEHIANILLPSRIVCLDAKEDTGLYHQGSRQGIDFRDRWRHLPTILATHFKDPQAKTFVLKLGNHMRSDRFGYLTSLSFDLSLLQQLASCSQLDRLCVQVETVIRLDPAVLSNEILQWEPPLMRDLTEAVANMGRRIIKGGRETTTDMEDYWAESKEVYESGEKGHVLFFRYTIERA